MPPLKKIKVDKTADIKKELLKFTLFYKGGYYIRFLKLMVEYTTAKNLKVGKTADLVKS